LNFRTGLVKMFSGDIEKKIVDIVKKSPLGLTSSEIAKYLGVNRVTLTKYLAVIREKALLDFKQFGMAAFIGNGTETLAGVEAIGSYLAGVFSQIVAFVVPAVIVVGLKQVWSLGQNQP